MKAKNAKWPLKPDHITNDGERHEDSPLRKLTGVGIISNEYLQGIETSMCANIENPTTIVEFSPSGEPVRTDSRLLYLATHPPCGLFQKCTHHELCLDCDYRHASLLRGLTREDLNLRVEERIERFVEAASRTPGQHFAFVKDAERSYLEYDCPLLGYRELFFPVFFEGRVIAAFFVGQLCLEDKTDFIDRSIREFFERHGNPFNEQYLEPGTSPEALLAEIRSANKVWVSNEANVLAGKAYEELIRCTACEIDKLEGTLVQQAELIRSDYARSIVALRMNEFRKNLPSEESVNRNKQIQLWKNLKERLNDLVGDFAFKYVLVLGNERWPSENTSLLNVVAWAGSLPDEITDYVQSDQLRFNIDRLPTTARNQWATSLEDRRILDAIEPCADKFDASKNLVRVFPVPFFRGASLAIIVGYDSWNPVTSAENRLGGCLDLALQSFYGMVLSAFSAVLAEAAEANMKSALHIFSHEMGQITAGLDWITTLYLSSSERFRKIPVKNVDTIRRDIQSYLAQIGLLSNQAKLLYKTPEAEREEILPYSDLLGKYTNTYRLEADKKDLEFIVHRPKTNDPLRPPLFGDKALLGQLLYNLITNAIRYCHRGTRIILDCKKTSGDPWSPHLLSITDYGIKMEGGEDSFRLYWQGDAAKGTSGLGIGLYIAHRVAMAHGGSIDYQCTKISDFNVPLMEAFVCCQRQSDDITLADRVSEQLAKLKSSGDYSNVVATTVDGKPKYAPHLDTIVNFIQEETWEVTFTVTIPAEDQRT